MKTRLDVPVFTQDNVITGEPFRSRVAEKGAFVCRLKRLALRPRLTKSVIHVYSQPRGGVFLDAIDNAAEFQVEGGDFFGSGRFRTDQRRRLPRRRFLAL